ncbi:MAG: hypothetical protein V1859_04845 [archaeon]
MSKYFVKKVYTTVTLYFFLLTFLQGCGTSNPSTTPSPATIEKKEYIILTMTPEDQTNPKVYELNLGLDDSGIDIESIIINPILKKLYVVDKAERIVKIFQLEEVGIKFDNPTPPYTMPYWTCENDKNKLQPEIITEAYIVNIELSQKYKDERLKEDNSFPIDDYDTSDTDWKDPITYILASPNGCTLGSTIHPRYNAPGTAGCTSLSIENLKWLFKLKKGIHHIYKEDGARWKVTYITDPLVEIIDKNRKVEYDEITKFSQDPMAFFIRRKYSEIEKKIRTPGISQEAKNEASRAFLNILQTRSQTTEHQENLNFILEKNAYYDYEIFSTFFPSLISGNKIQHLKDLKKDYSPESPKLHDVPPSPPQTQNTPAPGLASEICRTIRITVNSGNTLFSIYNSNAELKKYFSDREKFYTVFEKQTQKNRNNVNPDTYTLTFNINTLEACTP